MVFISDWPRENCGEYHGLHVVAIYIHSNNQASKLAECFVSVRTDEGFLTIMSLFAKQKEAFTPSSSWSVDDSVLTTFRRELDESTLRFHRDCVRSQSGFVYSPCDLLCWNPCDNTLLLISIGFRLVQ